MSLIYKFKKEKLENGSFVSRPRILVRIEGENTIETPALIDSGCDVTVISKSLAKFIGLNLKGEKSIIYGHDESIEVIQSKASFTFLGKNIRENIKLNNIPILISLPKNKEEEEEMDITLGVNGIFDAFEITFKKLQNRIILKKVISKEIS